MILVGVIAGMDYSGVKWHYYIVQRATHLYQDFNPPALKIPQTAISVQYGPDKDFLIKYEARYKPKVTVQSSSQAKNIQLPILFIIGILIFTNK